MRKINVFFHELASTVFMAVGAWHILAWIVGTVRARLGV